MLSTSNHFFEGAGVPYNVSIAAVNKAGLGHVITVTVFTRELGNLYISIV